jgi:hypothetical protein
MTMSLMGVPALLVNFPSGKSGPDYAARAIQLSQQWQTFYKFGHGLFRPLSMAAMLGYTLSAYLAARPGNTTIRGDWKLVALSALCHAAIAVWSAVYLEPLNKALESIKLENSKAMDCRTDAEHLARSWIRCNYGRVALSSVAGIASWFALATV